MTFSSFVRAGVIPTLRSSDAADWDVIICRPGRDPFSALSASLMLFLLLYPAGKKWKFMQRIGLTRHWFRIHIVLGLVGPLLVLYHCNFKLGSTNSTVALTSMLVVAVSGIIGNPGQGNYAASKAGMATIPF